MLLSLILNQTFQLTVCIENGKIKPKRVLLPRKSGNVYCRLNGIECVNKYFSIKTSRYDMIQPQDFVSPVFRYDEKTSTVLPQSHLQRHSALPLRDPMCCSATSLPNLCPDKSTVLDFDVLSLFKHPQDMIAPLLRCCPLTFFTFPQSHTHTHSACPPVDGALSSTVSLPNF